MVAAKIANIFQACKDNPAGGGVTQTIPRNTSGIRADKIFCVLERASPLTIGIPPFLQVAPSCIRTKLSYAFL